MAATPDIHLMFANFFGAGSANMRYYYMLSKKMSEGHVCIDISQNVETELLEGNRWNDSLTSVFDASNTLVGSPSSALNTPFILDGNLLYTQRFYKYEIQIASFLQDRLANSTLDTEAIRAAVSMLQSLYPAIADNAKIDWQFVAAVSAIAWPFTIITGGPGTGKTTTISKILQVLLANDTSLRVALAAPTGKAAARMSESLKQALGANIEKHSALIAMQPTTIHRLLGYQKGSIYFKHDANNPLPYDVLIIDECSMVDMALFAKLLAAVPKHCKLLLLGDKNQLSSVEAGSLFGDLCNMLPQANAMHKDFIDALAQVAPQQASLLIEHNHQAAPSLFTSRIITLEQSHRFKDTEGIGVLSKAVIQNDKDILGAIWDMLGNNQVRLDGYNLQSLFYEFIALFKHYIFDENGQKRKPLDALKEFNYCRVLSASKQQEEGVYNLNLLIEQYLYKQGWIELTDKWYEYKPIMVTKNNYTIGLYNGDIGILFKDPDDGIVKAYFLVKNEEGEDVLKKVLPGFINEYETCFAMTIHKSQGSEFDNVLMLLPQKASSSLLSRELIYTGLTRAKSYVLVQADKDVFMQGCEQKIQRNSGLKNRLLSE